MNWVLEHLQLIIGAAAAIAYVLNKRRSAGQEQQEQPRDPRGEHPSEQAERTRRVQEEIRRKIAERRGLSTEQVEQRSPREQVPPLMRPPHFPPIDPFGGPMRRVVRKLEEAAAKIEERIEDPQEAARKSELDRQAKLAEKLRELELSRVAEERRAAELILESRRRQLDSRVVPVAIDEVRHRLRDPRELRRAVILREILGPPVAMR